MALLLAEVEATQATDGELRVYLPTASLRSLGVILGAPLLLSLDDGGEPSAPSAAAAALLAGPSSESGGSAKRAVGRAWAGRDVREGRVRIPGALRFDAHLALGARARIAPLDEAAAGDAEALELAPLAPLGFALTPPLLAYLAYSLLDRLLLAGNHLTVPIFGRPRRFRVCGFSFGADTTAAAPGGAAPLIARVTEETHVSVQGAWAEEAPAAGSEQPAPPKSQATFSALGGIDEQIRVVREVLHYALGDGAAELRAKGLPSPKGILLHGPPGTGKTSMAKAVAAEASASFFAVEAGEVTGAYFGEAEGKLSAVFAEARAASPAVIFIDEIDSLCPDREATPSDMQRRIVATLLTLIDNSAGRPEDASAAAADGSDEACEPPRLLILAATNRPDDLDGALRRPGRLDREVEVGVPTVEQRRHILQVLLKGMPCDASVDAAMVERVADSAHGYVGADLAALCKESMLLAMHDYLALQTTLAGELEAGVAALLLEGADETAAAAVQQQQQQLLVRVAHFESALTVVRPSCMREIMLEIPKTLWADIGGQEAMKQQIRESVEWPLKRPEAFARMGIRPPKGILLYGPPGCSKTLAAKALATESGLNFMSVKGGELFSKWVGESEKAVKALFSRARAAAPSVVFFDEIDALASARDGESGGSVGDRVLSQLLGEMDGVDPLESVVVVAATNRPDLLDAALLRPGRFDRQIYVGPPDADARAAILKIGLRRGAVAADVDGACLAAVASGLEMFSGADCAAVCREAALRAIEEDPQNAQHVARRHLEAAAGQLKGSISAEQLEFYAKYSAEHGGAGQ